MVVRVEDMGAALNESQREAPGLTVIGAGSTAPASRVRLSPLQQQAFDEFYAREFSSIAMVAGAVVGDRVRGEDFAQEALTRASTRWLTVSEYDRPGAWVRRVAINLAISARRRTDSERRAFGKIEAVRATFAPGADAESERRGDPAVWAAIDGLPPRQRAAVVLHYYDDLPVAEIADILDVSVSTATSHLFKARKSLAKALGEPAGDEETT